MARWVGGFTVLFLLVLTGIGVAGFGSNGVRADDGPTLIAQATPPPDLPQQVMINLDTLTLTVHLPAGWGVEPIDEASNQTILTSGPNATANMNLIRGFGLVGAQNLVVPDEPALLLQTLTRDDIADEFDSSDSTALAIMTQQRDASAATVWETARTTSEVTPIATAEFADGAMFSITDLDVQYNF